MVVIIGVGIPVVSFYIIVTTEQLPVEDLVDLVELLVEPVEPVELEV